MLMKLKLFIRGFQVFSSSKIHTHVHTHTCTHSYFVLKWSWLSAQPLIHSPVGQTILSKGEGWEVSARRKTTCQPYNRAITVTSVCPKTKAFLARRWCKLLIYSILLRFCVCVYLYKDMSDKAPLNDGLYRTMTLPR